MKDHEPWPDCPRCYGKGVRWVGPRTFTGCSCDKRWIPPPLEKAQETTERLNAEYREENDD